MTDNPYRLPRTVTPSHYRLRLEPNLHTATFLGAADIDVTVHEPVTEIVCNAAELAIGAATATGSDGVTAVATVTLDDEHERVTLHFDRALPAGPATVRAEFTGDLNDKLRGFYRSTFPDADGVERVIATTQFESTNARRAFPCWDEPDLKAVFEVTLVVPDDLLAVSCSAEVAVEPLPDGRRSVRFAPTMVMSTYLLAFVVGPLEATDPIDVNGTPLRVVHPVGKGHLTAFALDAGAFSLRHFEEYFAIPYPGDKLDLVAIPDFAFGAMENLGCVTFREVLLLLDPDQATQPERQRAADVIAHEIAHMWFGDLVTMRWWNGIWLKEAFATFMEMHATDAWRPDWERWVSFGLSRSAAFDVDSLDSTRSIEFPVISPADAEGMYDLLTYEKGAAVVRMLEQYLGEEVFRDGVRHYLAAHAYGNTETTDLWDAIEESSGQPVRRIMDSWIFQGGYPLVSAELGDGRLSLTQTRFRYDAEPDDRTWQVPVVARPVDGDAVIPVLLENDEIAIDVGPADAVVVNAGASGFYRVRYEPALRSRLLAVAADALAPIERYGLVDDAWSAVVAGRDDIGDYLRLVEGFGAEDDLSVWDRLLGTMSAIDHLVADDIRPGFQAWVRSQLGPAATRLGTDGSADDDDRTRELRGSLLRSLGTTGADPETRAWAAGIDDRRDTTDPALAAAAVAIIAANGGAAEFRDMRERFTMASTPQQERRYLNALASFPGVVELEAVLAMVLDGSIRTQDAPFVVLETLTHRDHGPLAWSFVEEHWDDLEQRFPTSTVARMLGGVRALSDPGTAARVRDFLADHPVPQGAKLVEQHLERLAINVGLRPRVDGGVRAHLG